jgi:anti-sigma28 factor (negative regulator of flagellin synthesis)
MISKVNSAAVNLAYANAAKGSQSKSSARAGTVAQNNSNKIETLKAAIESGEYKVDLPALANKMADELL